MRKVLFILLSAGIALSSCTPSFYQIYTVNYEGLKKDNNLLVYENEHLIVTYDLWYSGGNPGFNVINKTDSIMYIILPECYYVYNGASYDYYDNVDRHISKSTSVFHEASTSDSKSLSVAGVINVPGGYYDASKSKGMSKSVSSGTIETASSGITQHEKTVMRIPPRSHKRCLKYNILGSVILSAESKKDFPRNASIPVNYEKANSPVVFRNWISYSFDAEHKDIKSIENEFWISRFVNYRASKIKQNLQCPDGFYNSYKYQSSYDEYDSIYSR